MKYLVEITVQTKQSKTDFKGPIHAESMKDAERKSQRLITTLAGNNTYKSCLTIQKQ